MNKWIKDGLIALSLSTALALVSYFLFDGEHWWKAYTFIGPLFFLALVIGRRHNV